MILDDNIITKDMLIKNTYEGNYYTKKNAVMYDLQNGKQNGECGSCRACWSRKVKQVSYKEH